MAFANVSLDKNGTADTFRVPSPAVWGAANIGVSRGCPWEQLRSQEKAGLAVYDDFADLPLAPTLTAQAAYGRYKAFATAGSAISGSSVLNGVDLGYPMLQLTADTTAHTSSLAIAYPGTLMTGVNTTSGGFWFEVRLAISSIAASHSGFLVGLAETNLWTLATGVPYSANTDAITNGAAFIGFNKPVANTTTWNTSYSDRATALTPIGAGEVTGIAAFGFTKLGMVYDPANVKRAVRFFQDNVELPTAFTLANILARTNLKANSLAPVIAHVGAASAANEVLAASFWRWGALAV